MFDPASFKIDPDKQLSFELTFKRDVNEGLARFKKVVYNYNGDIHQPNFLKIEWNGQVFKGRMASLDVNYTSFKHDGSPLTAVVKALVIA